MTCITVHDVGKPYFHYVPCTTGGASLRASAAGSEEFSSPQQQPKGGAVRIWVKEAEKVGAAGCMGGRQEIP